MVGISWGIDKTATYEWASSVFDAYPQRVGIIVSHSVLESDGTFTGPGSRLHKNVVAKCPNVRLVLCGHYRESQQKLDYYDDDGDNIPDRYVNTLMFNFQEDKEHGLGYVTMLTLDPKDRSISAYVYSPYYGRQRDGNEGAFTLTDAY